MSRRDRKESSMRFLRSRKAVEAAGLAAGATVSGGIGSLPVGCVAADFTIAGSAPVDTEIMSGAGVGSWTGITIRMNDTVANRDGCKTQTIPLVYTLTAGS
jgi:hypothetical protein